MTDRRRSPPSHMRDQNLSSILDSISDDGPARPREESRRHTDERRYASLIEKAYSQPSTESDRPQSAGPATAPPQTTRQKRSWRRELTIAGITSSAAIVALIALYAPWQSQSPSRGSSDAGATKEAATSLQTVQSSPKITSAPLDRASTEGDRALQQPDRKVSKVQETTQQRLSEMEQRMKQMEGLQYQLTLLASRLKAIEDRMGMPKASQSARAAATDAAEVGGSDTQEAESRTAASGSKPEAVSKQPKAADSPAVEGPGSHSPTAPGAAKPQGDDSSHLVSQKGSQQSDKLLMPSGGSDKSETTVDSDASESKETVAEEGTPGKQWAISLIALASKDKIRELQRRYTAKGFDVEMVKLGRLFALRIPGFAKRAEAVSYSENVKEKLGIGDVWIYEY